MRIGLSVYGTTYAMGIHPSSGRTRITAEALMNQAAGAGLSGIELPVSMLQGADISALAAQAKERGMYVVIASGGYDPQVLSLACDAAVGLGAPVVRTVVGGAHFGGDRRHMAGAWQPFLRQVTEGLREAAEIAASKGVTLAVENHQDVASEELIAMCETIDSPYFGITLDTGNPLATAEEPLDFARRILPYLKHVHLKDYWIYLSEEGYRLVRCPIGQGAVPFAGLFELFRESKPELTMSLEIGALEARHTRVLEQDYWPEYPPRTAAQLADLLKFVQANAKPPGDWRTPYERGEAVSSIVAYENAQLAASIAYALELAAGMERMAADAPEHREAIS